MRNLSRFYLIVLTFIFGICLSNTDHLIFSRITVTPTDAEFISVLNTTNNTVNLSNYYITDSIIKDEEGELVASYYNLPAGANYWDSSASLLSSTTFDFIARFPDISISPNDSLILGLHTKEIFESYYNYTPDLSLFEDMLDLNEEGTISCNAYEDCPYDIDLLGDNSEVLILFYWDGESSTIKDVDYFLWGSTNHAMDKTNIQNYVADTPISQQDYIRFHGGDSTYFRIDLDEGLERQDNDGNGISGDDETSENISATWEISITPEFGCTNSEAMNYNPVATIDNGTCLQLITFSDVINNCTYEANETISCDGEYELTSQSAEQCPLYEEEVTISGVIVDYFDITPFNGPHSFTIQDENGLQIDFVVWPESGEYQDGFDISIHETLSKLSQAPFDRFNVQITGELGVYCDDNFELDINKGEWQVTVEYDYDLIILQEYNYEGYFVEEVKNKAKINPAPFVLIPSLGETLDFTYSHPENSRVIIRIYDLSGRFITSLIDKYVEDSGTWYNGINPEDLSDSPSSAWDGRDHLGQIVSPGTYFIHIEAYDFSSGTTYKDMAPIVVGVSP